MCFFFVFTYFEYTFIVYSFLTLDNNTGKTENMLDGTFEALNYTF